MTTTKEQRIRSILKEALQKIEAETGECLEAVYGNWAWVQARGCSREFVLDALEYTSLSERMQQRRASTWFLTDAENYRPYKIKCINNGIESYRDYRKALIYIDRSGNI